MKELLKVLDRLLSEIPEADAIIVIKERSENYLKIITDKFVKDDICRLEAKALLSEIEQTDSEDLIRLFAKSVNEHFKSELTKDCKERNKLPEVCQNCASLWTCPQDKAILTRNGMINEEGKKWEGN